MNQATTSKDMSAPSSCAQLLRKGRKLAAVGVKDLCLKAATASSNCPSSTLVPSSSLDNPDHRDTVSTVEELVREILDPQKSISDQDNIDWIRHILAGGDSFEEYVARLKVFDHSVTCGFVWTSNFGKDLRRKWCHTELSNRWSFSFDRDLTSPLKEVSLAVMPWCNFNRFPPLHIHIFFFP